MPRPVPALTACALLIGCPITPLPGQELCDEAGFAIASRTVECTGDGDLANRRFETFDRRFTCTVSDPQRAPVACYLECSQTLAALSCDQVEALGDDVGAWLGASPHCSRMFAELEGAVKPDDWAVPTCNPGKGKGVGKGDLGELCTIPGGAPATLSLSNARPEPVALARVDDQCRESEGSPFEAGLSRPIEAAAGVVFRVRSLDGGLLTEIQVPEGGSQVVIP